MDFEAIFIEFVIFQQKDLNLEIVFDILTLNSSQEMF